MREREETGGGESPETYRSSGESDGSSLDMADLESGAKEEEDEEGKPKEEETRDCRICHMELAESSPELPIELGCSCKGDLAAAHKHCAERWFRLRPNRTCEICGATAKNVLPGESPPEPANEASGEADGAATATTGEPRRLWRGHRLVNFLLACIVFAFVISWLFHFNGPG